MARALLGGLLYDTSNLRFMVKADTRTIAERLLTRGSLPPGLHFRHIYELTCGLTSADIKLKDDCLGRAQSKTVTVAGRPYNLKWVVVKREELTPAHVNWRDALVTDLGFGTNGESGGCDIVLTVFWNGVKYRGSLRAYNQGSQLNFIPVAEAVSGGRGHPGAVGFDFNLAAFPNDQVAIESIIEALQTHGILQN
jgi:hypothetical protein